MTKNINDNNPVEIISLAGFLKQISMLENKGIVCRGQSDKSWEVESGAYLRLDKSKLVQ